MVFPGFRFRCPTCGKSAGGRLSRLSFCGACGIPLAQGATRRALTPERAEWVVAVLRRRCWSMRIAWGSFLGGIGLAAWRFGPIEAGAFRVVSFLLLAL